MNSIKYEYITEEYDSLVEDSWETAHIRLFNHVLHSKPKTNMIKTLSDEDIRMEACREGHLKKTEEERKMRELRASLPTESAAGRAKRLAALVTPKKISAHSSNIFGHRRNGGGKGKKGFLSPTNKESEEAAAARLKRKQEKKQEKIAAEQERAIAFAIKKAEEKNAEVVVEMTELSDDEDEYDLTAVRTKVLDIKYKVVEGEPKAVIVKTPVRKHKTNTFFVGSSRIAELKERKNERQLCISVKNKTACPHGSRCRFSHSRDNAYEVISRRSEGFQLLGNKDKLAQNLKFSKMCKSVGTNKPCPHGENCRFAHNLNQLQIAPCGFGDDCRRVYFNKAGLCWNVRNSPICNFQHSSETKENFYSRTKLNRVHLEEMKANVKVKSIQVKEKDISPLVRCFDEGEELFNAEAGVEVSGYKKEDVLNFLMLLRQNNQISEEDYIFGPLYPNKRRGKVLRDDNGAPIPAEFQLAVTGKCKFNESAQFGIRREVGEEVGLSIDHPRSLRNQTQVGQHMFFSCNINNTKNIVRDIYEEGKYIPSYPYKNEMDDRCSKVGCVIYGNKTVVHNYMSGNIVQWDNEDKIIGVVAVSVREAIHLLSQTDVSRNLRPVMVLPVGLVEEPMDTIEQVLSRIFISDVPPKPVLKRQSNILF